MQKIGVVSYSLVYGDERDLPAAANVQRKPLDVHDLRERFQNLAGRHMLSMFYCSQNERGLKEYSNRLKDENSILAGDDGKFE